MNLVPDRDLFQFGSGARAPGVSRPAEGVG